MILSKAFNPSELERAPHKVVPKGFYELIVAKYLAQCLVLSKCFINVTHFLLYTTILAPLRHMKKTGYQIKNFQTAF